MKYKEKFRNIKEYFVISVSEIITVDYNLHLVISQARHFELSTVQLKTVNLYHSKVGKNGCGTCISHIEAKEVNLGPALQSIISLQKMLVKDLLSFMVITKSIALIFFVKNC